MIPVGAEENVVRAICTDKFDGNRISASLFNGENTSVSRLAMISLEDHWDMFREHVQKPPERWLEFIGEINVGNLQELGRKHIPAIELTVVAKPEEWNAAHAEIPQKITRGLAIKIVKDLKIHKPPTGFNRGTSLVRTV
jgi:hypothetical protein